jgi:hypothetical protein
MLLGTKKTLHDHIIEALLVESLNVLQIQNHLKDRKILASIQGIYKTLRELISEDIVVKQKKSYLISSVWRNKLSSLVSQRPPFKLSPEEQTLYRFKKIDHLDMFWKHIMTDIQNELKNYPAFHATAHDFWYFVSGRKESQYEYYEEFERNETYVFRLIGGTTLFDKKLKQDYSHDYQQYHFDNDYPFNRRDHLSVIGPYIITTRVSVSLARVTDRLYETCFTEDELAKKLEPEFKKHGTVVMTVEHNEDKAKKLRKKMSADFHIPREVRERFELF